MTDITISVKPSLVLTAANDFIDSMIDSLDKDEKAGYILGSHYRLPAILRTYKENQFCLVVIPLLFSGGGKDLATSATLNNRIEEKPVLSMSKMSQQYQQQQQLQHQQLQQQQSLLKGKLQQTMYNLNKLQEQFNKLHKLQKGYDVPVKYASVMGGGTVGMLYSLNSKKSLIT
ncbi:hypothetical protein J6590_037293 [Homalodisca vitripennis]|nr:hypothetical protein J6590_037293 [Homalodisca vitripennis]